MACLIWNGPEVIWQLKKDDQVICNQISKQYVITEKL